MKEKIKNSEAGAKNLLVSFSGGETSAFMAQWLNNHYEEYGYENIVFVFANTGLENEQTLEFVERCDKHFKLNVQWVEADVQQGIRKGTGFYRTDFDNASRKGEPFEAIIKKYGIPNQAFPHCTRELKQAPIKAFGKDWFNGEKYHTAIGIRQDEADRMNAKAKEMGFIYPLISSKMIPATKPMINFYWRSMPFRLELKGYQGNCATCWKKADKKLYQIAQENPKAFEFMAEMERKYPRVGNEFGKEYPDFYLINGTIEKNEPMEIGKPIYIYEGEEDEELIGYVETCERKEFIPKDRTFFRKNRSTLQILEEAKSWNGTIKNDADEYTYQLDLLGGESCEVFSECGS
jgi:hypothetical protein